MRPVVKGPLADLLAGRLPVHLAGVQLASRWPCCEGIYVDPLLLARRILDGPAYRP
jgi:hypothetical protein